ncbi:MAG: hypothetical protein JWL90_866 [Chthoniobacteraceae bacterium]|nr:hypothetical protein [Chthoniobacteraceae bacterium]
MQRETCGPPPQSALNQGLLRFTGALAALVGALVLCGWFIDSNSLKSVVPGLAPMRPQTAFGFVCAGIAFWLLHVPSRGARLVVRLNAALVGVLGGGTLFSLFLQWQHGLNLPSESSIALPTAVVDFGQMAPNTAAGFVLTAAALFLMSRPSKMARIPSLALALIGSLVFAFGLMVFTGYVANLAVGIRWWNLTGMALHTSLIFVLIGLGILSVAWEQAGLRWIIGRRLAACFLCGLGLFAAVATNSYRSTQEILEATNWVRHTHAIVAGLQQLWADIADSQSAIRSYLITGDQEFLGSNLAAIVAIHAHFDQLRDLTADNQAQHARLEAAGVLVVEWMELNRQRVEALAGVMTGTPFNPLVEKNDRMLVDQIRTVLDEVEKEEYALLAQREERSTAVVRKAFAVLPIGTLLGLAFLCSGLFLLNREVIRRQQSTEALLKSEQRLRSLVVASSQVAWISPPEGLEARPLFLDGAVPGVGQEVERYIPGELTTIHPEDLGAVQAAWKHALQSATPYFAEYRAREIDGTYRDYATRAVPVFNPEGRLSEWVGACSDITDRKQAERENRLLNAEMQQIVTSAGDGIVRLDAGGHLLFLNPAAVTMFGWEAGEIVGCSFHEKVHSRHADGTPYPSEECPALAALTDARVHRGADEFYWKKDGTPVVLDFISTPLFEEQNVSGVVILYHDTTERKKAEEALRASEKNFRELADAMPQIVWAARPDGFLDYYNNRWFAYTALSLEQTLGWGWEMVLHPDDLQNCINKWTTACRTGTPYEIEYRFKRGSDGSYRWHLGRALPVRDAEGTIVRWFGTSTDIEDQKRAEAQIRELNETLELRVTERTAQLERAVKELEAFSYSVSHDLRAPLRAIDGYSRMVMEDYGAIIESEGARLLGVIRSETQRMGQLIDDLLSFSRVGRQQMQSTTVDMHGLARSVFAELLGREPTRSVHFTLAELPPACGEAGMLRLVWTNLFSNALKFTNQMADARIEAGWRLEKDEQIYHIRDNGAGFDMRYEGKLFGVFQRLHGEAQFEGTGVGLALVQRIIHRHGGRVWAEGKVNEGATFYFALPIFNP